MKRKNIPWAVKLRWLQKEKKAIHANFFQRAILTGKVGQMGLVSGVQSGFISRSVHTRLQVSVCNGYDLCHHD